MVTWRRVSGQDRWEGLRYITFGYFKKVVIADNLAPAINAAFGQAVPHPSATYWWIVVTMFAFQIYCDFSGYSDIAIGIARWIGYDFRENFRNPYISGSLQEFWTRWHISLSTWFRDYVYIPLGGSRQGVAKSHRNMWITMVVSGLWHGASWNFAIWGGLHAMYLSIEKITKWPSRLLRMGSAGRMIATLAVVIQVWIGWVFFRADSFEQAMKIIGIMFRFNSLNLTALPVFPNARIVYGCLGVAILREIYVFARNNGLRLWKPIVYAEALVLTLMLVASVFLRGPEISFIYFQF